MKTRRNRKTGTLSHRLIQRERLRLDADDLHAGVGDVRSICDVIPELMKRIGLKDQHWIGELSEEWPVVVGEAVAQHTRPGRINRNELVVFVDSSIWLGELARYGRDKMLANLQKRFGANRIESVRLQLDPDG